MRSLGSTTITSDDPARRYVSILSSRSARRSSGRENLDDDVRCKRRHLQFFVAQTDASVRSKRTRRLERAAAEFRPVGQRESATPYRPLPAPPPSGRAASQEQFAGANDRAAGSLFVTAGRTPTPSRASFPEERSRVPWLHAILSRRLHAQQASPPRAAGPFRKHGKRHPSRRLKAARLVLLP